MKKLNIGIIGTGMAFERLHFPAFQQLSDKYAITALCDIDRFKAENWAKKLKLRPESVYTNYEEMLQQQDLDVIDIMVPIELNYKVTEQVAKKLAGQRKGIICEKPLAPNLTQAENARKLADKYRIPIMIAENYRYNQEVDLIRDMVRTKKVGDIYYFLQNRVVDFPQDMLKNKFPATEWRQYPDFEGGTITDTALHDIAALRHIFGAIDKLQAFGRPQDNEYAPFSVINVNLLFKSGLTGQFTFFCAGKEMQRPFVGLRIIGTEGMIYLEERDCGIINVAHNNGKAEQIPYEVQKGYYNELLNFYNAMVGQEPISVTPEMEYGDLKTVQDILRSIQKERVVTVDYTDSYTPNYIQSAPVHVELY